MPASVSTPFHATDKLHFGGLVKLCVFVRHGAPLALDAFSAWVVAVSTNNLKLILMFSLCPLVAIPSSSPLGDPAQDMKLGLKTR